MAEFTPTIKEKEYIYVFNRLSKIKIFIARIAYGINVIL